MQTVQKNFPIVAIGASAGGLTAYQEFFSFLEANTGMCYILIQHLAPKHKSMLPEIIARGTRMKVHQAAEGMKLVSNQVYVIPPNFSMSVVNKTLHLEPRDPSDRPHLPIDYFFRSLAESEKSNAVGIVLSGTGSDGADGLKTIKGDGGITFAQSPESAAYEGMPQSAITLDHVDFILPPQKIAEELMRICQHFYLRGEKLVSDKEKENLESAEAFHDIFKLMKISLGIDFTQYKPSTLERRIARRMALHKLEKLKDYLHLLGSDPQELSALRDDILIHVTHFFRDPKIFDFLKVKVFPEMLSKKAKNEAFRVWIAGCATGEEAYSIAICLIELADELETKIPIQIFATDLSAICIDKARQGIYTEGIKDFVSAQRLQRFFQKVDNRYQVNKSVRDMCVFAKHNVVVDPPFSRLDFISCRNLLIYMQPTLQKRSFMIFNYALNEKGLLLLGPSEVPANSPELFEVSSHGHKIFKPIKGSLSTRPGRIAFHPSDIAVSAQVGKFSTPQEELEAETNRLIAEKIAPCTVLVNEGSEIVQFRGDTSPFLAHPSGRASFNIFKVVNEGLAIELQNALNEVKKTNLPLVKAGLSLRLKTTLKRVGIEVHPILLKNNARHFLIVFKELEGAESAASGPGKVAENLTPAESVNRIAELTEELVTTRVYLESLNRDLENTNQELQSANEEILSSNEELQSTNEEIETTKEELQSTNEELATVNSELQTRNIELAFLSSDLENLFESVHIPILMIGREMKIRRFTPDAGRIFRLGQLDEGRPVEEFNTFFTVSNEDLDLVKKAEEVIKQKKAVDIEVQDQKGYWYLLQIKPYLTEGLVDGAIVTLIDIHALKTTLSEAEKLRLASEASSKAKDIFLATLSHELRTPLTTILSFIQMLRLGRLKTDASRERAYEMIERSTLMQTQLVNDLLDVSSIIMNKFPIDRKEVNLSALLHSTIESFIPSAEAKEIKIILEKFEPEIFILGDELRLQQVFGNLMTNAIKFSNLQGQIRISLENVLVEGRKTASIKIIDQGKGIDPQFIPYLFERFTQADHSSTRAYGGMGLGLAIVSTIIHRHGGTIEATSAGLEKGATFEVHFPIQGEKAAGTPTTLLNTDEVERENVDDNALKGRKILLVEDDHFARESLVTLLESFGSEVRSAGSVQEAIEVFRQFKPELLICDIAMPEENGFTLIAKIRKLSADEGGNVPALVLSAYAGKENEDQALLAGFQCYLTKPVSVSKLINSIRALLKL